MRLSWKAVALVVITASSSSQAIELDVSNINSIKNATSTVAYGLMKYYTGNITDTPTTIAVFPAPLYWWEAGAIWGALLDYFHLTGDSSYNDVTTQALLSQVGPDYDYMVPAQEKDEGNDDQAFWGFATMSAAEKNYPQPTIGSYSWLELTENLWNTQVRRWDTTSCGGGLKWQIFTFNNGYNYKNSISNGAFFQLSARLARFTGNQTYVDWAEKSLTWSQDVGLITSEYHVYDGTDDTQNCSTQDQIIWTYNAGVYLYGSAIMYNYTNASSLWETRTRGFLAATGNFFSPYSNATDIMYEPACETVNTCDTDQYSFKAYLSRFMWASTLMAPFTTSAITTLLQASSVAAAQACSGGTDGVTCGEHWYYGGYDGKYGVGQQLSAMETLQGLLTQDSVPPLHNDQVSIMVVASTSTATTAPLPTSTSITSTLSSSQNPQISSVLSSESSSSRVTLSSSASSSIISIISRITTSSTSMSSSALVTRVTSIASSSSTSSSSLVPQVTLDSTSALTSQSTSFSSSFATSSTDSIESDASSTLISRILSDSSSTSTSSSVLSSSSSSTTFSTNPEFIVASTTTALSPSVTKSSSARESSGPLGWLGIIGIGVVILSIAL